MRKLNRLPLMAAFFVLFSMMAVPQLSFADYNSQNASRVLHIPNVGVWDASWWSYSQDTPTYAWSDGFWSWTGGTLYVQYEACGMTTGYYPMTAQSGSANEQGFGYLNTANQNIAPWTMSMPSFCPGVTYSGGLYYDHLVIDFSRNGSSPDIRVQIEFSDTGNQQSPEYTWLGATVLTNTFDSGTTAAVGPFSSNLRRAVVLEAFYALRQSHDGGCDQTIMVNGNNDCVSSWNFLNDQTNLGPQALSALNSAYGYPNCFASDWAVSSDACYASGYTAPSFYSDVADYGYSTAGGNHGSVGRGAQCVFFANNILYRSQSDMVTAFSFDSMASGGNNDPNLQDVVEGDVIFLYGDSTQYFTTNHVAIVVQVYRLGSEVTALDVIDSNYVSDISETPNREVIARHSFCAVGNGDCSFTGVQMIQGHYKIWTGTSYYTTSYDPNQ